MNFILKYTCVTKVVHRGRRPFLFNGDEKAVQSFSLELGCENLQKAVKNNNIDHI